MFKRKKRLPSVDELMQGEVWVKENLTDVYGWPLSEETIEKKLCLRVEFVKLDDELEAELVPDSRLNGCIKVNNKYSGNGEFRYLHEVVHYVLDVGVGEKVVQKYPRKRIDNSCNEHERKVDYLAAVALIPAVKLYAEIKEFRKKWFVTDEVAFMKELQKRYSCSEKCLRRRFQEVHKLRKSKEFLHLVEQNH